MPPTPSTRSPRGCSPRLLCASGDTDRAAALIRQQGDSPTPLYGRALYHLYCSEIDAAAEWWAKMIEQRELFAVEFVSSPEVRPLRESPHWPRLAALMNLPSERGPDRHTRHEHLADAARLRLSQAGMIPTAVATMIGESAHDWATPRGIQMRQILGDLFRHTLGDFGLSQ